MIGLNYGNVTIAEQKREEQVYELMRTEQYTAS
jgi:hypothetical protein